MEETILTLVAKNTITKLQENDNAGIKYLKDGLQDIIRHFAEFGTSGDGINDPQDVLDNILILTKILSLLNELQK